MKNKHMLSIRPLEIIDKQVIFNWRNNPETRSNSFNQNEISEAEHELWFAKIGTPKFQGFMGIVDVEKKACVILFKSVSTLQCEISINMNPAYRGLGFSKEFLTLAINQYRKLSVIEIVARIKRTNQHSQSIFKDLGFEIANSGSRSEIKMILKTSSK